MADTAVQFELVSPEQLVVSEDVEMVVVPGGEGDIRRAAGPFADDLDGAPWRDPCIYRRYRQFTNICRRRICRGYR